MDQSILIVGLGNVGSEYENTRHNIGFRILDQLAQSRAINFQKKRDLKGEIGRFECFGKTVTLLKPTTYMNLSGESLRKVVDYYKIVPTNILIIVDDVDISLGDLRLRSSGSSGGHNGLKSVEAHLGSKDYYRLKVGVGRKIGVPLADFVLGRFEPDEEKKLKMVIDQAETITISFIERGYQGALDQLARLRAQNTNTHSLES